MPDGGPPSRYDRCTTAARADPFGNAHLEFVSVRFRRIFRPDVTPFGVS